VRILVVSNLFPPEAVGGYELRCAGIVDALRERHEVTVLTSSEGGRPSEPGVLRTLQFMQPTKAHSLRAPMFTVAAVRAARAALERERPELIFFFNGANVPQAALRVLELSGVPVAWSVGEQWFSGIYRYDQFLRHLYPGDTGLRGIWAAGMRAVDRADPQLRRLEFETPVPAAVMWNTEVMRSFIPVPPTTKPVLERVIHPGTRHEDLYASLPRNPSPEPTIAFVGRVEEEKGPDVAVQALAELERRHRVAARLVMCGSASPHMTAVIEALARELGVAERVELRGFLGAEQLGAVLASAHVMLAPYVWDEPLGLVCVEAGLARAPVVASLSGGMPELLRDGKEALFFPKGDVDACVKALARTLSDPDATAARVERAFVRAREFGWKTYVERVEGFAVEARELLARSATVSV
jgi:glycogen(starch) synthase